MLTSDESQQRNGRTAGSLGDAQLLFDKATAKVVIAEDSLMKCSEAFDIHLIRFTCFLFFSCTHDIVDCCTSMCGYMCLHGSSMFFMSVSSWSTWTAHPKHPKTTYRCAGWDALLERHRGLAQGGRASARAACHACRCMSMHVYGLCCTWMYLVVLVGWSW